MNSLVGEIETIRMFGRETIVAPGLQDLQKRSVRRCLVDLDECSNNRFFEFQFYIKIDTLFDYIINLDLISYL